MSDVYGGLAAGQAMVKDASLAKREVLSHAKIFVRKGHRACTRHGILRNYLQTEHHRYQEKNEKNLSHGSPPTLILNSKNSLMSFETDGVMQTKHGNGFVFHPPGKAGRE